MAYRSWANRISGVSTSPSLSDADKKGECGSSAACRDGGGSRDATPAPLFTTAGGRPPSRPVGLQRDPRQ
eukprot:1983587-Prymnesium_polylepis.1